MIPPLQFGGVQDAVTAALPLEEAVTVPTLAYTELVSPVALTDCGLLDTQVSGTPVSVLPMLSITVAFSVAGGPSRKDVVEGELPATFREIDCTGQVVNGRGCEVTPPVVAKMEVVPGISCGRHSLIKGCTGAGGSENNGGRGARLARNVRGPPIERAYALGYVIGSTRSRVGKRFVYQALGQTGGPLLDRQVEESVGGWLAVVESPHA